MGRSSPLFLTFALILTWPAAAVGAEPKAPAPAPGRKVVDRFEAKPEPSGYPPGWHMEYFRKKKTATHFEVVKQSGNGVLHASSKCGASLLVKPASLDLTEVPILTWRWKVRSALPKGNGRRRSRDDYAARIYVSFRYDPKRVGWLKRRYFERQKKRRGFYPPGTGVCMVWANRLKKGQIVGSPYARKNVAMVAVESGNELAGEWLTERCNVLTIYRRFFKCDPPPVTGVCLSSDSDNTEASSEAWFDDIAFEALPGEAPSSDAKTAKPDTR